ncbi:MAG: WecB/TagA/CpsF family glycosyltransferase [Halioglobus sp.]
MSTATHYTARDCSNSLGIPVDNLTLQSATQRIIAMAKQRDGRARLVSTLNVDFLVNALGLGSLSPRHPELLDVLRHSDLVTADGFPIIWLSRITGKPLQQRVAGSDLTPEIAREAARNKLSIFLLGGGEGVAAEAGKCLQNANPELQIAGTAAPYIHTSGDALHNAAADDDELLATINSSGADILLVGLGNPKQELWFNRNRERLQVPVSIGVGGTFEFITGTVKRAPQWMQSLNLEWLFRITQDPGRLWKRYAVGLAKLAALSAPLISVRAQELLRYPNLAATKTPPLQWRQLWSSRHNSLQMLRLPRAVTRDYIEQLLASLAGNEDDGCDRLLDFSAVQHIEVAGHHAFFALSDLLRHSSSRLTMLGLSPRLRKQLSACRVLDLLGDSQDSNDSSALNAISDPAASSQLQCKTYLIGETSLIFLGGQVRNTELEKVGLAESLRHCARNRQCVIDLRNALSIDSPAVAALHKMAELAKSSGGSLSICGASRNILQMFKVTEQDLSACLITDRQLLELIAAPEQYHA